MNDHDFGPRYPAGEQVLLGETERWYTIISSCWDDKFGWVYSICDNLTKETFEVDEWEILF